MLKLFAQRAGKSEAMERYLAAFLKKNPRATVMRVRGGEIIVEKHVQELGRHRLPPPRA